MCGFPFESAKNTADWLYGLYELKLEIVLVPVAPLKGVNEPSASMLAYTDSLEPGVPLYNPPVTTI